MLSRSTKRRFRGSVSLRRREQPSLSGDVSQDGDERQRHLPRHRQEAAEERAKAGTETRRTRRPQRTGTD